MPDDYQQLSPRCPDISWVSPSPRKAAPISEWERIKAINPFLRFRRFPNQDEVFNSLHDRQVLGNQNHARARPGLSLRFIDTCMIFTSYFKDLLKTFEGAS
jgi:hypothetical protein